jgi:RNA-directed DNA polymerase
VRRGPRPGHWGGHGRRGGAKKPVYISYPCHRNKRTTLNALAFEINAEANLLVLQQELRMHTYRPGRSICCLTDGPKPREVFAADFCDRVVHHLLVSHQERIFEALFIHDSYACRTGKGTLAASDRLMACLRQVTVK